MNKVEYHIGTFKDYTGTDRKFVMAAVSIKPERYAYKALSVGVAVCRPEDEFDEELGKQIAYGKAMKDLSHRILSFDPGYITHDVAVNVLKAAVKQFVDNPGIYLAGYNRDAAKYAEKNKMNDYMNSLTDEQTTALGVITSMEDEELDKFTELANYIRLSK